MERFSKLEDSIRESSYAIVARKASDSLKSHETQVIREWLKSVIDELGLLSLQTFPTQELATSLPELISALARAIQDPSADLTDNYELNTIATHLATIRKEEPSAAKLVDDCALLKKIMLKAAAQDLRDSDMAALNISQRLDDSFRQFFKAGIEAYIEQHSQELKHLANTDALTGLFNVRYFRQQLHRNLEMFKRYRIPFSLLMIDLDKLKQLNDTCGHQAGDRALKHLASIMIEEKRETDTAVRYGGDEFFLLLPGTTTEEAERLAIRINKRVRDLNLSSGGREMTGISIGIVSCPADGSDVGTLRAKADRALYLAKSIGGGSVARYQEFSLEPQVVF